MNTTEKIVFEQGSSSILANIHGKFFVRVLENGEYLESQDFNTIESAKSHLFIGLSMEDRNEIFARFMGGAVNVDDRYFNVVNWSNPKEYPNRLIQSTPINFRGSREETYKDILKSLTNEGYGSWGQFHKDWNWLIQVVDKIESLGGLVSMSFPSVFLHFPKRYKNCNLYDDKGTPNILKVHQACYDFIVWHNNQK